MAKILSKKDEGIKAFNKISKKFKKIGQHWYADYLNSYIQLLKFGPETEKFQKSLSEHIKNIESTYQYALDGKEITLTTLKLAIFDIMKELPKCYKNNYLVFKAFQCPYFDASFSKKDLTSFIDFLVDKVFTGEIFHSQNPADECLSVILKNNPTFLNIYTVFNSITMGKINLLSNDPRRLDPSLDHFGFMEKIKNDIERIWEVDRNEWMKEYILEGFTYSKVNRIYYQDLTDILTSVNSKLHELNNLINWLIKEPYDKMTVLNIVNESNHPYKHGFNPESIKLRGRMIEKIATSYSKSEFIEKVRKGYENIFSYTPFGDMLGIVEEYTDTIYQAYETRKGIIVEDKGWGYDYLFAEYWNLNIKKLIKNSILNDYLNLGKDSCENKVIEEELKRTDVSVIIDRLDKVHYLAFN